MRKNEYYLEGFKAGWKDAEENLMLFVEKCTSVNVNDFRKELNAFCNADGGKE